MKKSERSHEAVERAAQWPHEPRKSSIRCYQHYSAPWGSIFPIPTSPFYTVFLNKAKYLNSRLFEVVLGCWAKGWKPNMKV